MEGNKENRCFHLVRWKFLISSKRIGSVGIRNLRLHKKSLLWKWLWRYNTEVKASWRKVFMQKYGQQGHCSTKSVSSSFGLAFGKQSENIGRNLL